VLKQPYGPFLGVIALGRPHIGAIVSKAAADKLGNDNYTEHPIGTGPFVFESQLPNQQINFSRNERYYEGPPKVGRVRMLNMADETTLGLAVEKVEVHIGNLRSGDFYQKYKDTPTTRVVVGDRFNSVVLTLNTTLEPLSDLNVRRALAHSVNAREIVQGVFRDVAQVASAGILHPRMLGYNAEIEPWTHEPERAMTMLAEAGASGLSTTAVTYTGSQWTTVLALLQQQMAAAGVDFQFAQLERGALNQRRAAPDNPLVLISFTTGGDPDRMMSYFHSSQIPPGGLNFPRYSGADELIDRSRVETDQEKRAEIIKQVQAKFAEDVPGIALYHAKNMVLLSKQVRGYQYDPLGGHWLAEVSLA
jgi:peptide/nickel transport system substrate-binding protein